MIGRPIDVRELLTQREIDDIVRGDLPDSRLTNANRPLVRGPLGLMERVFCASCGRNGGLVTKDWAEWIFYLCTPCARSHGEVPAPQIPDAIVRGQYDELGQTL